MLLFLRFLQSFSFDKEDISNTEECFIIFPNMEEKYPAPLVFSTQSVVFDIIIT